MSENNKGVAFSKFKESILGTAAILGALTLIVGFMLAAFNSLTAPIIEKRLQSEMEDSISGFFGRGVEFEYIDFDFEAPVTGALYVREASSKKLAGYCVTVAPKGFSGNIVMLVAVNANITVRDAKILEMSETAGIGSKIQSESWFVEQFKTKPRDITAAPGANAVDVIAGATKSSKAFLSGVNAALEAAYEIKSQLSDAPNPEEETKPAETTEAQEDEEGETADE
ncbi:MAG: FMN-binding protein [Oscillospiraceae bacterium]|nr:FMN-binding protein [Oscillospiraceae bacterium]